MSTKPIIAAGIGACLLTTAQANEPAPHQIYVSAEYFLTDVDINNPERGSSDGSPQAFGIRIGQQYSRYFAIEALIATATSDDGSPFFPEFEINGYYQFSAIGFYPVNDWFSPFLRLGATYIGYETSNGIKGDGTDFTYGLGAKTSFSENWGGSVEYSVLPDANDANTDFDGEAISLGVHYRFSLD